jgi:hypothetical protein
MTAGDWWKTIRAGSDFTTFVTVSHRSWFASEPIPKTVQTLLRHTDVKLTLQFYSHAVSQDRMAAAGKILAAILSHAADQSGLGAD